MAPAPPGHPRGGIAWVIVWVSPGFRRSCAGDWTPAGGTLQFQDFSAVARSETRAAGDALREGVPGVEARAPRNWQQGSLEVIPMPQKTVALRERGRLAALLHSVLHQARRQPGWREPDRRNTRTWRRFVLGVVVAHSTRLVTVSQVLFGQRAATRVKAVALGLASFLTVADFPAEPFRRPVLEAGRRHLAPARVAASRGKAVGVRDPTEYPKRSRGRSERGRPMPHVGRVRKPAEGGERCTGGSRAQPRAVATRATKATEATEAK